MPWGGLLSRTAANPSIANPSMDHANPVACPVVPFFFAIPKNCIFIRPYRIYLLTFRPGHQDRLCVDDAIFMMLGWNVPPPVWPWCGTDSAGRSHWEPRAPARRTSLPWWRTFAIHQTISMSFRGAGVSWKYGRAKSWRCRIRTQL